MKALGKLKLRWRISHEGAINEDFTLFVVRSHGDIARFRTFRRRRCVSLSYTVIRRNGRRPRGKGRAVVGFFARLEFAGQPLGLGNLILGQSGLQCGQAHFDVRRMFIVLGGRKCKPFVGLHLILGQTHTLLVTSAELILSNRQPIFSSTPDPSDTFFDVLRHSGPLKVTIPELILRRGETLLRGLAEPIDGFASALPDAAAAKATQPQLILRLGHSLLGCFAKPFARLGLADFYSLTIF